MLWFSPGCLLASMWLQGLFPSASSHKGTFVQIGDNQGGATWQTGIFNEHLVPRGVSCFSWSFLSQRATLGLTTIGSVQEGVSSFENLQLSRDLSRYPQRQLAGPSCYSNFHLAAETQHSPNEFNVAKNKDRSLCWFPNGAAETF